MHLLPLWTFVVFSRVDFTLFLLPIHLKLDVFLVFPHSLDPSSVKRLHIQLIVNITRAAH